MLEAMSQDVDESLFGDDAGPPKRGPSGEVVKFYQRAVVDELKSWGGSITHETPTGTREEKIEGAGRLIAEDKDFIEIRIPGDKTMIVDREVRNADKKKYAALWREYAAMKADDKKNGTNGGGTPVDTVPWLTRSQVEELKFLRVRTVEQLAELGDAQVQAIGMGAHKLRTRAQDFLDQAKGSAASIALRTELEKRDAQIAALQSQMQELLAARSAVNATVEEEAPAPVAPKVRRTREARP